MIDFERALRPPSLHPSPAIYTSASCNPRPSKLRSRTLLRLALSARPPGSASMRRLTADDAMSSVAEGLWIDCKNETIFVSYTPFVVCLLAGKLSEDAFRSYIAQEVHFLKAFAQAYEMAGDYADDDDKAAINKMRRAVLEKLKMHDLVVREVGIDPTKEVIPNAATLKYTEFLLATAAGKIEGAKGPIQIDTPFEKTRIAAYVIGAIAAGMRLVAYLGNETTFFLQNQRHDHRYEELIKIFSSPSFETSVAQIEELLDKLSASLTGEELQILRNIYHRTMKIEIGLFNAQPVVQPAVVPFAKLNDHTNHLVIFSDFDSTCTLQDSSGVLAEITILSAPKADRSDTGNENPSAQRSSSAVRNDWKSFSKQYADEYKQCIENLLPPKQAKVFSYESLYKVLCQVSNFEKQANSRVIKSGLLKGINLKDIKRAGQQLSLREGCKEFLQEVMKIKGEINADFHILSYCWCADLIRSALSSGCLNDLTIHSNELNYEQSVSTGSFIRRMESPIEKVETFKGILANLGSTKKHLCVYVGGAVGDLLCLLEADVGIVIGSSPSLRRVGEQFGALFVPLYPGVVWKQTQVIDEDSLGWKGLSGVLYTASSWIEIHAFLLGHKYSSEDSSPCSY